MTTNETIDLIIGQTDDNDHLLVFEDQDVVGGDIRGFFHTLGKNFTIVKTKNGIGIKSEDPENKKLNPNRGELWLEAGEYFNGRINGCIKRTENHISFKNL